MPRKEWTAAVNGHDIRVVNSWTGGTALYIDGECRDRNSGLFALTKTRWLSARLNQGAPESGLVEVFVEALFSVKAQIVVAGVPVAGDSL